MKCKAFLKKLLFTLLILLIVTLPGYMSQRPQIGLVLSGGGAKGLAHIGTLKLLDELEIPIDCIVGTSIGGILGALYAIGYSGNEIENIVDNLDWNELFTDQPARSLLSYFEKKEDGKFQIDLGLKKWMPTAPTGMIHGQKLSLLFANLVSSYAGVRDFDHLPIPFRCLAVDLVSGQQVILKQGSLAKAMRATMSIPTLFSPVDWEEKLLVDGGILNNLPVDVAKEMGADIVIAVDLGVPLKNRLQLDTADKILSQTISIVETNQKIKNKEQADILINPELQGMGSMDFFFPDKLEKIKKRGKAAAGSSLPQLQELKRRYALLRSPHQQDNLILKPVISSINIVGNKLQPAHHIVHFLGLKPGDQFKSEDINNRIMKLYGLGYFKNIRYDIFPDGANQISLRIEVKELPLNKIRFGLKYNNLHKLVAITGLHLTNTLLPGLRVENEAQLLGSTQINTKIYYPAWDQKLLIYPLFSIGYKNIPTRIFDGFGHRIASYNNRSWHLGFGLGCNIAKWINAEVVYDHEQMNIQPSVALPDPEIFPSWKDSLKKIYAEVSIDTLDDILLPAKGFSLKARFEGSYAKWNSDVSYTLGDIASNFYMTFFQKHTVRLFGYLGRSSSTTPVYKFFNNGRPERFVGMRYDQLYGSKMNILRLDYRYKFHKYVYFKLMGNIAFNFEYHQPGRVLQSKRLWGAGAGIKINLPFGPIEFIYSLGSKNLQKPNAVQGVFYISLGTLF